MEQKILGSVLILCPEDENRNKIVATVRSLGLDPLLSSNYREARNLLRLHNFAAAFCSDTLEDATYPQIIDAAKPIPVIVLSRFAEWGPCLAALAAGAFDYIPCPPDHREVERILSCAISEQLQILHGSYTSLAHQRFGKRCATEAIERRSIYET